LIRHTSRRATSPVRTLPVAMIEPALQTPLMAAVGSTPLPAPSFGAASRAAIALPAVAVRANPEHRLASLAATKSQPENHFSLNCHPPTQAGFDNGNGSCQGKTSFDSDLLMKVAQLEPRCLERRGSLPPSRSPYNFSLECFNADDWTDDCAFGADNVAWLLKPAKTQKTTFSDDRQHALAWVLAQKPWIVPIPGTTKLHRLQENVAAASIELREGDLREIESATSEITVQGARYSEGAQRMINR
jgi:hypothetical protein